MGEYKIRRFAVRQTERATACPKYCHNPCTKTRRIRRRVVRASVLTVARTHSRRGGSHRVHWPDQTLEKSGGCFVERCEFRRMTQPRECGVTARNPATGPPVAGSTEAITRRIFIASEQPRGGPRRQRNRDRAFVCVQHVRRVPAPRPLQSLRAFASLRESLCDTSAAAAGIGRIEVAGSLAADFGHRRTIRGEYGAAAGLGFDDGPAETFFPRGEKQSFAQCRPRVVLRSIQPSNMGTTASEVLGRPRCAPVLDPAGDRRRGGDERAG